MTRLLFPDAFGAAASLARSLSISSVGLSAAASSTFASFAQGACRPRAASRIACRGFLLWRRCNSAITPRLPLEGRLSACSRSSATTASGRAKRTLTIRRANDAGEDASTCQHGNPDLVRSKRIASVTSSRASAIDQSPRSPRSIRSSRPCIWVRSCQRRPLGGALPAK